MPGMKKRGVKKPAKKVMKKGATPGAMSYDQATKVIMNKGGAPVKLINALKKKYPAQFGMGGKSGKPLYKRGGKTGYGKRKK